MRLTGIDLILLQKIKLQRDIKLRGKLTKMVKFTLFVSFLVDFLRKLSLNYGETPC